MGVIIAKFKKKPSTYDVLTKLENEIIYIEDFQKKTKQTQRKFIFRFILVAGAVYIIIALLLYLYFSKISPDQKLFWSVHLIMLPFGVWIIKRLMAWYFNRKILRNEKKLIILKEQKKKILENVKETETYKVAKEILDKFANDPKQNAVTTIATVNQLNPTPVPTAIGQRSQNALRRRSAAQNAMRGRISFGGSPETPINIQKRFPITTPNSERQLTLPSRLSAVTPHPLVRDIFSQYRSPLDKMVDYLLGNGPSNKYALICQECSGHNGMAVKEEFEYTSFRCCYCSHFNPSRKKRPAGPQAGQPARLQITAPSDLSGSERSSESECDQEPPALGEQLNESHLVAEVTSEREIMDDNAEASLTESTDPQRLSDGNDSDK
ncbi:endoplasmic reticulum junction formation protein lunapark isoform X1 [Cylas formicarius]|uniref:endoplasmic reticulum junction formation protein lunapark isoform X1 n=1 Tax=Cylas formicarius TaxID=197179 RepID=UPI002958B905|nr:endoplasmic reticulum junction formation protein lunapark isoform X1 [Cylas formicarius]